METQAGQKVEDKERTLGIHGQDWELVPEKLIAEGSAPALLGSFR